MVCLRVKCVKYFLKIEWQPRYNNFKLYLIKVYPQTTKYLDFQNWRPQIPKLTCGFWDRPTTRIFRILESKWVVVYGTVLSFSWPRWTAEESMIAVHSVEFVVEAVRACPGTFTTDPAADSSQIWFFFFQDHFALQMWNKGPTRHVSIL